MIEIWVRGTVMSGKKRWISVLLAVLVAVGAVFPVLAATGTKINTVSLKITSTIEAGKNYGDVNVTTSNSRYVIEEFSVTNTPDGEWKKGARPKVKITLVTDEGEYYFKSGFSKDDVSLSGTGATVSSVSRSSNTRLVINVTLNALAGDSSGYELDVYGVRWDEDTGYGYWEDTEDGKRYELKVYRGNSLLNSSTLTTTENSYNFSQYITRSGTYTFQVRSVYNSSNKGEWTESDDWYVDSETAGSFKNSGSSSTTSVNTAGSSSSSVGAPSSSNSSGAWLQDSVGWWYCNADRSYTINGWQSINNKWYYFDERGYMMTGWILWKNVYYYCGPDGAMLTNTWTPDGYYVDSNGVWVQNYSR